MYPYLPTSRISLPSFVMTSPDLAPIFETLSVRKIDLRLHQIPFNLLIISSVAILGFISFPTCASRAHTHV